MLKTLHTMLCAWLMVRGHHSVRDPISDREQWLALRREEQLLALTSGLSGKDSTKSCATVRKTILELRTKGNE